MTRFPIFIPGTPIPQGSKSVTRTGIMFEANNRLKPWRETMSNAFTAWTATFQGAWEPFDKPLAVDVTFHIPRPKRPKFDLPATPADLDKYQRALGDAMKTGGILKDDSRITTWHARKRYSDRPGVEIHDIREDTP